MNAIDPDFLDIFNSTQSEQAVQEKQALRSDTKPSMPLNGRVILVTVVFKNHPSG
jgi:hypothetical protein